MLILESAGNAHSEPFIITLLLGVLAHRRFGPLGTLPLFSLSALVKPIAASLVPLYLVYVFRSELKQRALKSAAAGFVAAAPVVALAYLPFWAGPLVLAGLITAGSRVGSTSIPTPVNELFIRLLPGHQSLAAMLAIAAPLLPAACFYFLLVPAALATSVTGSKDRSASCYATSFSRAASFANGTFYGRLCSRRPCPRAPFASPRRLHLPPSRIS